jgi:hypothetical protein
VYVADVSLGLSLDEVLVAVLIANPTLSPFVRAPREEAFLQEISIVDVIQASLLSLLILSMFLIVFKYSQAFL